MRGLLVAIIIAATAAASAQEYETVLLPIAPGRVIGAFGSQWETVLYLSNVSETPLSVSQVPTACNITCNSIRGLAGGRTAFVSSYFAGTPGTGYLVSVERGRLPDLAMTLRTRDQSRQSETWGTSIPTVRPEELFSRTFGLVDIPMEPQFRATLRVYDVDRATPPRLRVRIYEMDPRGFASFPDPLIQEYEPALVTPIAIDFPPAAEIPLWLDPELVQHKRIRIELEPLDGAKDYWGFVSVTHNATQHVTLITPQ